MSSIIRPTTWSDRFRDFFSSWDPTTLFPTTYNDNIYQDHLEPPRPPAAEFPSTAFISPSAKSQYDTQRLLDTLSYEQELKNYNAQQASHAADLAEAEKSPLKKLVELPGKLLSLPKQGINLALQTASGDPTLTAGRAMMGKLADFDPNEFQAASPENFGTGAAIAKGLGTGLTEAITDPAATTFPMFGGQKAAAAVLGSMVPGLVEGVKEISQEPNHLSAIEQATELATGIAAPLAFGAAQPHPNKFDTTIESIRDVPDKAYDLMDSLATEIYNKRGRFDPLDMLTVVDYERRTRVNPDFNWPANIQRSDILAKLSKRDLLIFDRYMDGLRSALEGGSYTPALDITAGKTVKFPVLPMALGYEATKLLPTKLRDLVLNKVADITKNPEFRPDSTTAPFIPEAPFAYKAGFDAVDPRDVSLQTDVSPITESDGTDYSGFDIPTILDRIEASEKNPTQSRFQHYGIKPEDLTPQQITASQAFHQDPATIKVINIVNKALAALEPEILPEAKISPVEEVGLGNLRPDVLGYHVPDDPRSIYTSPAHIARIANGDPNVFMDRLLQNLIHETVHQRGPTHEQNVDFTSPTGAYETVLERPDGQIIQDSLPNSFAFDAWNKEAQTRLDPIKQLIKSVVAGTSDELTSADIHSLAQYQDWLFNHPVHDIDAAALAAKYPKLFAENARLTGQAARLLKKSIPEEGAAYEAAQRKQFEDSLNNPEHIDWIVDNPLSGLVSPETDSNPANRLIGKDLRKLDEQGLKDFEAVKNSDPAELLKTSSDPSKAAALYIRANQPEANRLVQRSLTNDLLRQHGYPPIPPKVKKGSSIPPVPKKYDNPINSWEDFVGKTQAASVRRDLTAKKFESLRELGTQGLHDYEANPDAFPELKQFFANKLEQQKKAGVPVRELQNYLYHAYEGTPEQFAKLREYLTTQRKQLRLRPGHTLPRELVSYKVAEQVFGLKPKFDNLADLAGEYEFRAEKAIADRGLYNHLKDNQLISTKHKAGWQEVEGLPSRLFKTKGGGVVESKWFAEPKTAKILNNYYTDAGKGTQVVANIATNTRNLAMGGGIPGTGWNAHGINLYNRYVKSAPTVAKGIERAVTGLRDLSLVNVPAGRIEKVLDTVPKWIEHGLTMTAQDFHFQLDERPFGKRLKEAEPFDFGSKKINNSLIGKFFGKGLGQAGEVIHTTFDKPLFNRVLPYWKLAVAETAKKEFMGQGLPEKAAMERAAEWANTVMSGRNWERAGESRAMHTRMRAALLSPDWLRSNVEMSKGVVKSITNPGTPEGKLYRRYVVAFTTMFGLQQGLAKLSGGRFSYKNPPGHLFDIYAGQADKEHERYLVPQFTSEDWIRIPAEVGYALYRGDEDAAFRFFQYRLSTLVSSAINVAYNRNYAGQKLRGEEIPAGRSAVNTAEEITKQFVPPSINASWEASKHFEPVKDFVEDNQFGRVLPWEQVAAAAVEAPLKYIKERKTKTEPFGLFDLRRSNKHKRRTYKSAF